MKEIKFKRGIDKNQAFLFARKPEDFLPENHLAKAIYEIAERLDMRGIEGKYSHLGQNAYEPRMMTRILFNGYSVGIRSSRKLSKACEERIDFIYQTGGLRPSHDRISDFRKDNLEEMKQMFKDIVMIGANLGLSKVGNLKVSIDGTKVRANASAKLSKDEDELKELHDKITNEIDRWFEEAEQIDAEEDAKYGKDKRGDELPGHLRTKESRKKAIEKAIKKLREQKELMKESIRAESGREPTLRESGKIERMKINVTDNEAKFMQERYGVIKPNYNAQLSVDEKNQFIVANDVTDECTDCHQLIPMLRQTKENIGRPNKVKADNGYIAQLEQAQCDFADVDFYIGDRKASVVDLDMKEMQRLYDDARYKNLRKIRTKKGRAEYKKRMHTVEPPIGDLKHNLGYRHFLLRGLLNVKGEFNLMCIAHNLKKIWRFASRNDFSLASSLLNLGNSLNGHLIPMTSYS